MFRQVAPRTVLGTRPSRSVRSLADGTWLRSLLRHHRRRVLAMGASRLRPDDTDFPTHRQSRLPPHRGSRRQGHRVDAAPARERAAPTDAVLLLDARRACTASRAARVDRQVRRAIRRRLGFLARGDLCPPARTRRHPSRHRTHVATRTDPRVERLPRALSTGGDSTDGDLRRLPRPHRSPDQSRDRRARRPRHRRQHARHLHHRRQRRVRGRNGARRMERTIVPERRARGSRVAARSPRRLRHGQVREPLQRRLGVGARLSLPVDEAGRLALRRHPQRDGDVVAEAHRRSGRTAHTVPPRDRPRPDDLRGGRHRRSCERERNSADADARRVDGVLLR